MAHPPSIVRRFATRLQNLFLWCGVLACALSCFISRAEQLTWGTNVIVLGAPLVGNISSADLLTDAKSAVVLNRFYRAGGENLPVTPTECRIAYNTNELLVVFRCGEKDLAFPALSHAVNWYSQSHNPPDQDAAFPDKVDLFVSPDTDKALYYHFAVTLDGQKFAVRRNAHPSAPQSDEDAAVVNNIEKVKDFSAVVSQGHDQWTVRLRIPWKTLGGRPASHFGLIPVRTRWRDGEVTSPVAADFTDRPPLDLFIETYFPGADVRQPGPECWGRLPSGIFRWQRPALLTYPNAATVREIWKMEQSLSRPTDPSTMASRVRLTQRWVDLLTLEGFNFRSGAGSIVDGDMSPSLARRAVNAAAREGDTQKSCQILDAYLRRLDRFSRDWFADGAPGDTAVDQWKSFSGWKGFEETNRTLVWHGLIGERPMDLCLSLPQSGGVRLRADAEGFFKPDGLRPLNLRRAANGCSISYPGGKVTVRENRPLISLLDSSGKAIVQIDPGQIAFRFGADGKVLAVDFRTHLEGDEVIYGFGEKYDRFNQNGNVLTLWGVDDWMGLTAGLRNQSYKPVPVFHSSKGYAMFLNSSYRLRADVGKTQPDQLRLTQQGPILDDYYWIESPKPAIESYTSLTGKPLLPPRWAFEPWMGRTGRGWGSGPQHNAVAEQEQVIERFAALDIPHSAIYAEGSGADSADLNKFAAARGIHVLSWANSCISPEEQKKLLPGERRAELPVLATGGGSNIDYVDFTNPNAEKLSEQWWSHRLKIGVAGSMIDFGDRTPEAALFHDGQRGDEMHNFYSYDYHKTDNEVFHKTRGDDFILFGRAAAPGTQRWAAQFAGDHPANFSGLQAVRTGALNLSACGFSTWGSDLGGFLGWPEPDVYIRWTQFACFSPLMRSHGRTPREPWEYGQTALDNYKRCAWLRENLLDYIYQAAVEAHQTGIPMMRSLAVAYPQEPSLARVDDQYLLGDDLLVAPVITEENSRTVLFPPGRWTSLWDGKTVNGPARLHLAVPQETIPVFLKEGAIIPMRLSTNLQFGESMTLGEVRALIVNLPKHSEKIPLTEQAAGALRALDGRFVLTCKNLPEVQYLLLYGASVRQIRLDGKVLGGWSNDPVSARMVVPLPVASAGASPTRQIEVELDTRRASQ